MDQLLPDQLKELWHRVEQKELLTEEFNLMQERGLAEYRKIWSDALFLEGYRELEKSLLDELGFYVGCQDSAEIQQRCSRAVESLAKEWREKVDATDRKSVENFYNETEAEIYELMWWHVLSEDLSPLSYVTALHFALREGCHRCLDFGAGVGSGGILFARHGLDIALADISSPLLVFSEWRFRLRKLARRIFRLEDARPAKRGL